MYFWHNGILTHDVDKTIDFLCAATGAPRDGWTVMEIDFAQSCMIKGAGGKLRAAFSRVGGVVIELLQPLDDHSYHAGALKARGPGFHHNAYVCENDQDETLARLVKAGGKIVWEFLNEGEHACYVEAGGGNAVLEIINRCPFMPGE